MKINIDELTVLEELQHFIPRPDEVTYRSLKMQIRYDKEIKLPILTTYFNNQLIVVDGHTRLEIAQALRWSEVPIEINESLKDDMAAIKQSMIDIQIGRRNITDKQRKHLLGKQYELNKQTRGRSGRGSTRAMIAKKHKATQSEVNQGVDLYAATKAIEATGLVNRNELLTNKMSINKIVRLSKTVKKAGSEEEKKNIVASALNIKSINFIRAEDLKPEEQSLLSQPGLVFIDLKTASTKFIAYCKQENIYYKIDLNNKYFGNPYELQFEADGAAVLDKYQQYLATQTAKLNHHKDKLYNKVVFIDCKDEPYFGDVLKKVLEGKPAVSQQIYNSLALLAANVGVELPPGLLK